VVKPIIFFPKNPENEFIISKKGRIIIKKINKDDKANRVTPISQLIQIVLKIAKLFSCFGSQILAILKRVKKYKITKTKSIIEIPPTLEFVLGPKITFNGLFEKASKGILKLIIVIHIIGKEAIKHHRNKNPLEVKFNEKEGFKDLFCIFYFSFSASHVCRRGITNNNMIPTIVSIALADALLIERFPVSSGIK